MLRDSTLAALMSFAVIALVAIAFFRPDAPPGLALTPPAFEPEAEIPASTPDGEPSPSPAPIAARSRPVRISRVSRSEIGPADESPTKKKTAAHPPARAPQRRSPASAFSQVREAETLADVAWRVYGDESAVSILRSANRDQLPGPTTPVQAGMSLRTP